jgi:hypothetical protein
MFVQAIEGRVADGDGLRRQLERMGGFAAMMANVEFLDLREPWLF